MDYLDTSFVIAALSVEGGTARAQAWLQETEPGSLASSAWVTTEVASAIGLKLRTGAIDFASAQAMRNAWTDWYHHALRSYTIERKHFLMATDYLAESELGLRAGDALHLAIVSNYQLQLVTFDKRMAAAAIRFGIALSEISMQ